MKIIPIIYVLVHSFQFIEAYNPYLDTADYVLGTEFYESISIITIATPTTTQESDDSEINKKLEDDFDPEQFGDYDDDNYSYGTITSDLSSSSIITSLLSTNTATLTPLKPVSLLDSNYQSIILWNTASVTSLWNTDMATSSLNTNSNLSSGLENSINSTNSLVKGSRIGNLSSEVSSEIQNKSFLKFATGVGEFICGFFVICSLVDTAVNLGIDIGEAITGKEKVLNEIIRNSTKLVEIR